MLFKLLLRNIMRDLGARAKVRGGRPLRGGIPIWVPLWMALVDLANICFMLKQDEIELKGEFYFIYEICSKRHAVSRNAGWVPVESHLGGSLTGCGCSKRCT